MLSSRSVDRKYILPAAGLLLMTLLPLYVEAGPANAPDVKQVKVIAERASVYIEPSRGSTRIDIVGKGALLNLLQTKKVKDVWYYVSYSSSRYGTRVSGFVLDSAVELVGETIPSVPEEKKPEKKAAPPAPVPPRAEEKEEIKPEPPPAPRIEEVLIPTDPLAKRRVVLPRKEPPLQELVWQPTEVTPRKKEASPIKLQPQKVIATSESLVFTEILRRKSYTFPRMTAIPEEVPWRIEVTAPVKETKTLPPVQPEKKKEAEPRNVAPSPPTPEKKEQPKKESVKPQAIRPPRVPAQRKAPGRFAFGLGYGSSFGGAGACLQFNTGMGIALHAGAGIFPTRLIYSETDWVKNETLWSVGIKYYLPIQSSLFFPYLDIQYGGLRVEAAQVITGIWEYDYVYSREQKALWGPSFLGGVEIRKGGFGICGALGISYVTTSWEYLENKVSLSFDTSLMVHF
jgi:hypothetical protein